MQSTHGANVKEVLAVSLELSAGSWKIAATDARRAKPAVHTYRGEAAVGRLQELLQGIEQFKAKWKLSADCLVWVLYEAGQDGFWIARALQARGEAH